MPVQIPPDLVDGFRSELASDRFRQEERDYKWAVHLLVSKLLSEENFRSPFFPENLADLMSGHLEPSDVGLSAEQAQVVQTQFTKPNDQYQALANLCGGRWVFRSLIGCPSLSNTNWDRNFAKRSSP